jgi:hypothetical protein
MRNAFRTLVRKCEGKKPLGKKNVDGRHILKCVLEEYDTRMWTGFIPLAGSCEDGDEASVSTKDRELIS